jgi:hypothetical protein
MKKLLFILTAFASLTMAIPVQAGMPLAAREAAYYLGKIAAQHPPGYFTDNFLRKQAIADGCNTSFWIKDFILTERDQEQYFRTHS